ncbi:hypothetical protein MTO96_017368 [Rhipicephalus appendiculatus]
MEAFFESCALTDAAYGEICLGPSTGIRELSVPRQHRAATRESTTASGTVPRRQASSAPILPSFLPALHNSRGAFRHCDGVGGGTLEYSHGTAQRAGSN